MRHTPLWITPPHNRWTAPALKATLNAALLALSAACMPGAALAARAEEARIATTTAKQATHTQPRATPRRDGVWQGSISFYGPGFHGKRTANGERFNAQALTMAHRTLPFGTMVRVTNLRNGRSVVLRVNDRGPWARGRIADVSVAAARALGMHGHGVVRARLEVGTAATHRRR